MNLYMISFDYPAYDLDQLKNMIKRKYVHWWNYVKHTYIIETYEDKNTVVENFRCMLESITETTAQFIVVKIDNFDNINGWLPQAAYHWISDKLLFDDTTPPHVLIDEGLFYRLFGMGFNRFDLFTVTQVDALLEPLKLDPSEYQLCRDRLIGMMRSNLQLSQG